MKTNRRRFISTTLAGGMAAALPISSFGSAITTKSGINLQYPDYNGLNEIEKRPVLKRQLFSSPVIIKSIELLRNGRTFLCRVRSADGAEGISAAHEGLYSHYLIFLSIQRLFIGKDARDLDSLIDHVYILNYRLQGIALGIPTATIEFAILDMLGRIAKKSMGLLIGEIHKPKIEFYLATENRGSTAEETLRVWKPQIEKCKAKEIKIRVGGGHMTNNVDSPPGRTDKLIPLFRKTFGDKMVLYADSNGFYSTEEAIRAGRLLEEYKFEFFEEPVPFDWYEETKQVADTLKIPIAGGEQEYSLHGFRWLIANDALKVVQPDLFYFGGMIRSMKVALMANALGKKCTPHMTGGGLGFLYSIHFVSSLPNALHYHEFKGLNTEVIFESPSSSLKVENGMLKVPVGPGSGVIIDRGFIAKHQVIKS